jgi:hypothetical protein
MLLSLLRSFPAAAKLFAGPDGAAFGGLYASLIAVGLLVCGLLWLFPLSIARKLLPAMREPRSEQVISAPLALSLGLALIGLWLLANAAVELSYWLGFWLRNRQFTLATGESVEWSPEQVGNVLSAFVQLALGVWLALGAAGLRRLVYRMRFGQPSGAP